MQIGDDTEIQKRKEHDAGGNGKAAGRDTAGCQ